MKGCKIIKQIYNSLDEYDRKELFDSDRYNELNKIRKELVKKFSKDFILQKMTFKQYVEADGNKRNYCYLIERKLRGWGSILGATNKKFGIYKEGKKYKATYIWDDNGNANKGFKKIKQALYDLLEAGKRKDYDAIENSSLSPMFKSIILSLYYDKDYIAINKIEDVDLFLSYLQINYNNGKYNTLEKKKSLLIKIKKNVKAFKSKSNYYFIRFLYKYVKGAAISKYGNTKKISIDSNRIEEVGWNYIKNHDSGKKNVKSNNIQHDFEKENRNKMSIGERGEFAILQYEKNRLIKAGKKELAKKVRKVSGNNDNIGYDIVSYDLEGKEKHIEVKTKSNKKEMLDFYITENELKVAKNDKKHVIYYLFDVTSKNPKLHIVDKKQFKNEYLKPVLYKVKVDVKRKNMKNI